MSKQRQHPPKSRLILELSPELAVQLYSVFHQNEWTQEDTKNRVRRFLLNSPVEENLPLPNDVWVDLIVIKTEFKELVIEDVGQALKIVKDKLLPHTSAYDTLVILYARFNRINRSLQQNIVEFSIADLEMSKLENAFIYLINNLTQDDLK